MLLHLLPLLTEKIRDASKIMSLYLKALLTPFFLDDVIYGRHQTKQATLKFIKSHKQIQISTHSSFEATV